MSIAVVTGAGGIGGACAEALVAQGTRVALIDRDSDAAARGAARLGPGALGLAADVTDPDGLAQALDTVRRELGEVRIAVSAVAHEEHGGLEATDDAALRRSLEGTVVPALRFCRFVAEGMGEGGRIVIVGSLHGVLPFTGAVAYNAAHGALRQLAGTLAHELLARRIGVDLVEPGWIDTPGERRFYSEEQLRQIDEQLPWGLGTPADIGAAVAFLASARWITGATLRVDGGMSVAMARLPGGEE